MPLASQADSGGAPQEAHRIRVGEYINAVTWGLDGSRLAALSDYGGRITIWEARTWSIVTDFRRYGGAYSFNSFAYLRDGTLLTTAPIGKSPDPKYETLGIFCLVQWNPATGQPVRYIPNLGRAPKGLPAKTGSANTFTVSPDGSLVACISGPNVLLFDTQSWSLLRWFGVPPTAKHPDNPNSVVFSPNSDEIAVGTGFGNVHFCKISDGSIRLSFSAFSGDFTSNIGALAFTPDGQFVAASRTLIDIKEKDDGWTRIFRVGDGTLVARLMGSFGSIRTSAWSPDGNILATGDDRRLLLWRTHRLPAPPSLFAAIQHGSFSMAFSPQGVLAASDADEIAIYR